MKKKNKIFTDDYMKTMKQTQYTGVAVGSLKKIVLLLGLRCAELEQEFRQLQDEVRRKNQN